MPATSYDENTCGREVSVHELSLCQSIFTIADRSREGRAVEAIHLRIGRLRQVVPDTLTYCWGVLTDSTELSGSWLEVEEVPIELCCRVCGARTVVGEALVVACHACESGQVELVTGEECLLTSMDLAGPVQRPAPKESHG